MAHPYLALLRERPVRTLWIGLVVSDLGSELYRVGAVWLAAELAGANASLLVAAQSAAILASALLAGMVTELWPRRRFLIGGELLAAAAALAVVATAMVWGLSFPVLVAASVLLAAIGAAAHPVILSSLPLLAAPERIRDVSGLFDASTRAARAVGPFFAAALMGVIPAIHLLTANALSFLVSAAAMATLGRRLDAPSQDAPRTGFLRRLGRGVRAANACPAAWAILLTTSVRGAAYALGFTVGVPLLFAQQPGEGGLAAVALVFGAAAAGELLPNPLLVLTRPKRPLRRLFEGYLAIGAGLVAVGWAASLAGPVQVAAMAAAAFVTGLGGSIAGLQIFAWFGSRLSADDYAAVLRLRLSMIIVSTIAATAAGPWILPALGAVGTLYACGAATLAAAAIGGWSARAAG